MKKLLTLFAAQLIVSGAIYAQEIIVKNDGSVINAYRTDYNGQMIYYQTEDFDTGAIYRIKKEDVLVIRFADGTAVTPNIDQPAQANGQAAENTPAVEEEALPDVDLTDYHGFLLDKGNCVYVAYNNKVDYEIAAVDAMKKAIKESGLWKVVDKPSQAHFVLQYNVCLVGRDFSRMFLRPRDNYLQIPYMDFGGWNALTPGTLYFMCGGEYASEEIPENVNAAQSVIVRVLQNYKSMLESAEFMESVKTGKLCKSKGSKERWYIIDFVTMRYEPKAPQIKTLHELFYK
jgi:hypothetical protein